MLWSVKNHEPDEDIIEPGMPELSINDEDVNSLLDGLVDELDLLDRASIENLSLPVLLKIERVNEAIRAEVPARVKDRVAFLTAKIDAGRPAVV